MVPDVRTLLIGPTEEDPDYFSECHELVRQLGLDNTFEFTGRVNLKDYLGQIDVVVLTSISEAQPLVLLEAGAAGIPSVATDVGSCRDILYGRSDEEPPLGPGGLVTPLANPIATAEAVARLLQDRSLYRQYSSAIQNRARRYYNKHTVDQMYCRLYEEHLGRPDRHRSREVVL
jgi:glycosyltransferase involved in cell wall biosynthesis